MEPLAYLHLQLRLEGKEVFDEYSLRQIEAVPDETVPLILIAQLANQELVVYYDEAMSPNLQNKLIATDINFPTLDPLIEILNSQQISFQVEHSKTYIFPIQPPKDADVKCLSKLDSKVKTFGFDGFSEKVYVMECEDNITSACVSTRENEVCGEAWVYTTPEHRKKGFAQKVVNAWASDLIDVGKVPFYSHKIENSASANVARKLGLQLSFEEISILKS